jgi:NADH-quinone oxidoreductase subunit C
MSEPSTRPAALERAQAALGDRFRSAPPQRDGLPCLEVEPHDLAEVCRALRDRAGFDCATFVTAVDHYPKEPRFELVIQLLSVAHNDRLRLVAAVTGESVPSITPLWPGAAFMERECFDLFGIRFEGHPDLKRLLMPEDYEHHPLRKDFPHQGIEPDRLYREWDRGRRERTAEETASERAS